MRPVSSARRGRRLTRWEHESCQGLTKLRTWSEGRSRELVEAWEEHGRRPVRGPDADGGEIRRPNARPAMAAEPTYHLASSTTAVTASRRRDRLTLVWEEPSGPDGRLGRSWAGERCRPVMPSWQAAVTTRPRRRDLDTFPQQIGTATLIMSPRKRPVNVFGPN